MDSPPKAPPKPNGRRPGRLLFPQQAGLVLASLNLALALVANSPLGAPLRGDVASALGLYWIALAANVGSTVCAIGLGLRSAPAAWSGAAVFLALAFLLPQFWYVVPFALGLLGCVLAWEMQRPRPPPAPRPPDGQGFAGPAQWPQWQPWPGPPQP